MLDSLSCISELSWTQMYSPSTLTMVSRMFVFRTEIYVATGNTIGNPLTNTSISNVILTQVGIESGSFLLSSFIYWISLLQLSVMHFDYYVKYVQWNNFNTTQALISFLMFIDRLF